MVKYIVKTKIEFYLFSLAIAGFKNIAIFFLILTIPIIFIIELIKGIDKIFNRLVD